MKDSNVSFGGSDRILGTLGSESNKNSPKNFTKETPRAKDLNFKPPSRFGPKFSEKNPDQIPTDRFSKSSDMSRTDSDEKPNKLYSQAQPCRSDSRLLVHTTKRQSKVIWAKKSQASESKPVRRLKDNAMKKTVLSSSTHNRGISASTISTSNLGDGGRLSST